MMDLCRFNNVALSAVSAAVPKNTVLLSEEAPRFGVDDAKLRRLCAVSGLHSRRVAPESLTAADLCAHAADRLLTELDIPRQEVDALIFVSQTPDYQTPASASILQHRLRLSNHCAAFDMNAGCSGFIHAFWIASSLVASRARGRVLILVGDTTARFLDAANRVTAPVFGDGGAAALVEFRPGAEAITFLLGNDGGKFEAICIPGGGARIPMRGDAKADPEFFATVTDADNNPWTLAGTGQLWMDGLEVFEFSVSVVPAHISRHLALLDAAPEELDHLVLHHGNLLMLRAIARKVGVAMEKVPFGSLAKYGNLGAASIPVALCEHMPLRENGEKRTLLCGFGAGLSWASCHLALDGLQILDIRELDPPPEKSGRRENIRHWHKKFTGENG